jgi:hypothetical protein
MRYQAALRSDRRGFTANREVTTNHTRIGTDWQTATKTDDRRRRSRERRRKRRFSSRMVRRVTRFCRVAYTLHGAAAGSQIAARRGLDTGRHAQPETLMVWADDRSFCYLQVGSSFGFPFAILRHLEINPHQIRRQQSRGDDEHAPQPKRCCDRTACQRPQRIAQERRRRRHAIDQAAF